MSAHTPGPWKILRTSDDDMLRAGLEYALYTKDGCIGYIDGEPDARLIAAAPRMREALIDAEHALFSAMPYMPNVTWDKLAMQKALDVVRAILRDVKGEGNG